VKNPRKLQEKLVQVLKGVPKLHVFPNLDRPWNDLELKEVAWIVQDHIVQNDSVIESDDPLREWLEEYKFFESELNKK
jgi:hypothetical protein